MVIHGHRPAFYSGNLPCPITDADVYKCVWMCAAPHEAHQQHRPELKPFALPSTALIGNTGQKAFCLKMNGCDMVISAQTNIGD